MSEFAAQATLVEISPVFPTDIDIPKNRRVKLAHKEYAESVEQKDANSWFRLFL
jgi:hypothetical protein